MNDLELLRILLVKIKSIQGEKNYRAHSYGMIITLLLSTELFKSNKDIQSFLELNGIEFRPYVYGSRTQIVGRVCRVLDDCDLDKLKEINSTIKEMVFYQNNYIKKSEKSENESDNYFDSLLDQFGRGKHE